jgi:hypothetical protein
MVASVNAASLHTTNLTNWQPRNLNQDDSTQFDPGIMDTSASPASYSLSPQQYMPPQSHHQQSQQYQFNQYQAASQPVYQLQNDIQFDLESLLGKPHPHPFQSSSNLKSQKMLFFSTT